MDKITVIGAGNVGATVANVLAHKDIVKEVVIVDIKEGKYNPAVTNLTKSSDSTIVLYNLLLQELYLCQHCLFLLYQLYFEQTFFFLPNLQ